MASHLPLCYFINYLQCSDGINYTLYNKCILFAEGAIDIYVIYAYDLYNL